MDRARVFAFLDERLRAGTSAVLVTVIAVEGSSMREAGTHMGVAADGSFCGSLSGGCIENAVVAEALDTLAAGAPRLVRFGAGSPYLDIKLPCGGGLDIHFQPLGNAELTAQCLAAERAREPFSLELGQGAPAFLAGWRETAVSSSGATIGHWPAPRLAILGHGASVAALTRLAVQMDVGVHVFSPDTQVRADAKDLGVQVQQLASPSDKAELSSDKWTAIIFLFHDHEWEADLMARGLALPHFYLGAMGGRKAHQLRQAALAARGVSAAAIASIHAPIGLFHSARDPDTLALSTLAQVVERYHASNFADG